MAAQHSYSSSTIRNTVAQKGEGLKQYTVPQPSVILPTFSLQTRIRPGAVIDKAMGGVLKGNATQVSNTVVL